jgi:2-dehydro-3-deoxyphosphooctonate aldolase (KDO 8-P synthase)
MSSQTCTIGDLTIGNGRLALIAGPCVAESRDILLAVAGRLTEICRSLDMGFVFKSSFDKANRSSISGYRGPGIDQGLSWLVDVRNEFSIPVLTDIHQPDHAAPAAVAVDCLQIPAFLCRQTDLLLAAGQTGKAINIKKGQFMAPWEMSNAVEKVRSCDNQNVLLTERGTFFGYNRLVTDLRAIPEMRRFAPVVFDATHSVQQPGGLGKESGGQRQYAPMLACAAVAAGADAIFIETHPDPDNAKSDAASQIPLDEIAEVLKRILAVHEAVKNYKK